MPDDDARNLRERPTPPGLLARALPTPGRAKMKLGSRTIPEKSATCFHHVGDTTARSVTVAQGDAKLFPPRPATAEQEDVHGRCAKSHGRSPALKISVVQSNSGSSGGYREVAVEYDMRGTPTWKRGAYTRTT